jgi:hypothetical protein
MPLCAEVRPEVGGMRGTEQAWVGFWVPTLSWGCAGYLWVLPPSHLEGPALPYLGFQQKHHLHLQ